MCIRRKKPRLSSSRGQSVLDIQLKLKSEDCLNSTGVGVIDEGLDSVCLESVDQGDDLILVLVTIAAGDEVCIVLSGLAGSILNSQSVSNVQTGLQSVVAVDNCDSAFIGVCQLCGDGVSLNSLNVVAAVINDVKVADALLSGGILGESDQAFLLEQEQCAGLVGVVSGDEDGCAFCDVCAVS